MTSLLHARDLALQGRLHPTGLTVEPGELVALIGPNGGGKTSLLRAIAGTEGIDGAVTIAGELLAATPPARRPSLMTFLPASRDMAWPIAARDVIALGLPTANAPRVETIMEQLELQQLAGRPINRLSTGERTRVLLGRALAPVPHLLLLDEPLSNLDPYWVLRFLEIVRDFVSDGEHSAIVALHDLDQAAQFNRLILVNHGTAVLDGTPSLVLGSEALGEAFGIERREGRWAIRRPADPRSSP
jgi:iron complex transport system ATP-binding protein